MKNRFAFITSYKPNPWIRRSLPLVLGMMIAAFIAFWPEFQCSVLAQCAARDLWCNGDCSQTCQASTSLGYVASCSPVIIPGGSYCDDDFQSNACGVRCSDQGNCNVTQLLSGGGCSGRLSQSGSYSYWNVGQCPAYNSNPSCSVQPRYTRVDCCTGASGGGGGGGCDPEYDAPTITLSGYSPPFPLVLGQDPDDVGVDISLTAQGGSKSNNCSSGPGDLDLTSFSVVRAELSDDTISWINDYLNLRYPGAAVLGSYPFIPPFVSNLNGNTATLNTHINPLDPGWYEIRARAVQEDGQATTTTFRIPVYLLDATITLP